MASRRGRRVYNPAHVPDRSRASRAVALGIDRLLEHRSPAHRRPPRRARLQPGLGRRALPAHRRSARRRPEVTLAAIFGPQHGFRSDVQDNMIETPHAQRRAPRACRSTRSTARRASRPREMLRGLDVLVIDLQDVGTRIYTYIYTMANCLRAARAARRQVIVCDRPNPIGGDRRRGRRCSTRRSTSFVGQFPIPMRHGMTIGELARLFNDALRHRRASSTSCRWTAGGATMYFDETGLPWVMPSPNMPTLDSAIVYPGTVLFEGTMLSEGRGTTRPFELIGAPWIDGERFADAMNARGAAGRPLPAGRSSSRRSRSTRSRRAAAARSTSLDRARVPAGARRPSR